jgi:hypothetical protein
MGFDSDATWKAMAGAAQTSFGEDWPAAKDAMERVLRDERQALYDIAEARINGDITDEDVESQLADEKLAFEAGLAMVQVRTKKTIENAINAAMNVLKTAIETAIVG